MEMNKGSFIIGRSQVLTIARMVCSMDTHEFAKACVQTSMNWQPGEVFTTKGEAEAMAEVSKALNEFKNRIENHIPMLGTVV